MSKFDEQRESILEDIGELGGFGEAEKTASAEGNAEDGEISTEELAEKLGEMAEQGDGTDMPNDENAPSGESAMSDREQSGVPSGESAKNDGEEDGVPSGEKAVKGEGGPEGTATDDNDEASAGQENASTETQEADGATGENPNKNSETTNVQDVKETDKQAEEMPEEMKEQQYEDSDEEDSDEEDSDDEDSDDDSSDKEGASLPDVKQAAKEEIETDILEGALTGAVRNGLDDESVNRFTEKVATFTSSESTAEESSINGDTSSNRFTDSLA